MTRVGVRHLSAQPAFSVAAELGEGPVWDAISGTLSFIDILRGRLYQVLDGQARLVVELDRPLGAALPTDAGEFLLVTREGFSVLDRRSRVTPLLDVLGDRPDVRFNDAACDPRGRCFAGTLSLDGAPADGVLVRLDPPRAPQRSAAVDPTGTDRAGPPTVATVVSAVGLANGLGWSPDGRSFYFTDTDSGRVDRFDYDPERGELGARHDFVAEAPGTPDGLCVDDNGAVWIALWDGGEVHRYTPAGELDTVVRMPVPHVTSCAFGGSDGRTLMLTTARSGMSAAQLRDSPHAGDVFAVEAGVSGQPATPWSTAGFTPVTTRSGAAS